MAISADGQFIVGSPTCSKSNMQQVRWTNARSVIAAIRDDVTGAWLSGRAFTSHARGRRFDPYTAHQSPIGMSAFSPIATGFWIRRDVAKCQWRHRDA